MRIILILCVLGICVCACSSEDGKSIANTVWTSIEGISIGDAQDIREGRESGDYLALGDEGSVDLAKSNVSEDFMTISTFDGTYSYDSPVLTIKVMDSNAEYIQEGGILKLSNTDEHNTMYFPKVFYLCHEGESTHHYAPKWLINKTWKLTNISEVESFELYDFWDGDMNARISSIEKWKEEDNYTITFKSKSKYCLGDFSGKAIEVISGIWSMDDNEKGFDIELVSSKDESDVFAQAFLEGLSKVNTIVSNDYGILLYYKLGERILCMGFREYKWLD